MRGEERARRVGVARAAASAARAAAEEAGRAAWGANGGASASQRLAQRLKHRESGRASSCENPADARSHGCIAASVRASVALNSQFGSREASGREKVQTSM